MVPLVPLRITAITRLANGHILVQGAGAPNTTYHIEASPDLSPGSFARPLDGQVNSSPTGALQYEDANSGTKRFYRFTYP